MECQLFSMVTTSDFIGLESKTVEKLRLIVFCYSDWLSMDSDWLSMDIS